MVVDAPLDRLRTVAWGATALAAIAGLDEAAHLARAFHSVSSDRWAHIPLWERLFVDPPSLTSPFVALAAVLLVLMLPVAPSLVL